MAYDVDVVVVGAGLAGLACALRLAAAGLEVAVLDAADAPGGRVRTDRVDGFLLDRGFQVLLPAYPELRRVLDVDALRLQPFPPGVVVQHGRRTWPLADPFQQGGPLGASLPAVMGSVFTPADAIRMLRWRRELVAGSGRQLADADPVSVRQRLEQRGFSPRAIERFFGPFFAGVLFDPQLTSSSRLAELILRSQLLGGSALPAEGMQALPLQMASRLPATSILMNTRVRDVVAEGDRARVISDRGGLVARAAVVATDGPSAGALLDAAGSIQGARPAIQRSGRGATTLWYATTTPPSAVGPLVVCADGVGRAGRGAPARTGVVTVATVSQVAPSYAPAGWHLVAAVIAGIPRTGDAAYQDGVVDDGSLDDRVRGQLAPWVEGEVDGWRRLRVDRIPWAQPRQLPQDLQPLAREVRIARRVWICGDHRDTGTIQGSLVSGRRAAEDLLEAVG